MKLVGLRLVKGDHYFALYDQYGTLLTQGASLDWVGILSKNVCKMIEVRYADLDWLEGVGKYPDRYSDIMFSEV